MIKTIFAYLFVTVLLIAGCGKGTPPAQKQAPAPAQKAAPQPEPAKKPEPAAEKAPEVKVELETYTYEPRGKRDPFMSLVEASKREREAEKKKKGALAFDVADIKVIAIAWEKDRYYAMVQMPDMKYFTIKEGMTLGMYGGKVLKINKGNVLIREFIKDYKGEVQPKDTILRLRKEEGE